MAGCFTSMLFAEHLLLYYITLFTKVLGKISLLCQKSGIYILSISPTPWGGGEILSKLKTGKNLKEDFIKKEGKRGGEEDKRKEIHTLMKLK